MLAKQACMLLIVGTAQGVMPRGINLSKLVMKNFFIISCLLLISCNRQVPKEISVYEEAAIEDSSVVRIAIENLDRNKVLKCSEVFDSIRFVRLETTDSSLIGRIKKIVATNDYFFILDASTAKTVFVFDKTGKFLNRIGTNGNGPEEYNVPDDIVYDRYNDELLVWCNNHKAIMRFKPDGTFVENIKVDWWADVISIVSKDIYLLYLNNTRQKDGKPNEHNILVINQNGEIVNRLLPYNEHDERFNPPCENDFSFYGDTVLFSPYYGNRIYQINANELQIKYCVDFKNRTIPSSLFVDTDNKKLDKDIKDNGYAFIRSATETSSHVIIHFVFDRLIYSGFYSKESKSVRWTPGWVNDVYGLVDIGMFKCTDGDLLVSSVEPDAFLRMKDLMEKAKKNKRDVVSEMIGQLSSIKIPFLDNKLKDRLIETCKSIKITLSDEEIDFINSIEEAENPVLVISKLKKF